MEVFQFFCQEFLEQQLFTVVFEQMISSLLLLLRRRTLTSIDRIVKMYPLHVSITIASCHNTRASCVTSAKMKMCDNSISITLMTLRILLELRNQPNPKIPPKVRFFRLLSRLSRIFPIHKGAIK